MSVSTYFAQICQVLTKYVKRPDGPFPLHDDTVPCRFSLVHCHHRDDFFGVILHYAVCAVLCTESGAVHPTISFKTNYK